MPDRTQEFVAELKAPVELLENNTLPVGRVRLRDTSVTVAVQTASLLTWISVGKQKMIVTVAPGPGGFTGRLVLA